MIRVLVYADCTRCLEFTPDSLEQHGVDHAGVPSLAVKQRLQVRIPAGTGVACLAVVVILAG